VLKLLWADFKNVAALLTVTISIIATSYDYMENDSDIALLLLPILGAAFLYCVYVVYHNMKINASVEKEAQIEAEKRGVELEKIASGEIKPEDVETELNIPEFLRR